MFAVINDGNKVVIISEINELILANGLSQECAFFNENYLNG